MLIAAVVLAVSIGIVVVVALRQARRRTPAPVRELPIWTQDAGDEFSALSEAERCDLVFAVAALDDEPSRRLLERALDDPSEPVALAAAHALMRHGGAATVERYLAAGRNERARSLRLLVEILN